VPFNDLYSWNQAKAELKLRLGNRRDLTGSYASDGADRLSNWLDSAQLRIAQSVTEIPALEQSETFDTVATQAEYNLNSLAPALTNIMGIRQLRNDTTGIKMLRFPFTEYRTLTEQPSGAPVRWARKGPLIAFDLIPDDEYTIRIDFRRRPVFGNVELESEWHEDWIKLAEFYAWSALNQESRANSVFMQLPPLLQQAIQQPLAQEGFDSLWDTDLAIIPISFEAWRHS
jgi:hypothetical protein